MKPYQSNKNQSTPKKGEYKEQKWKDPHPKRQKIHLRRRITRGKSSSQTPSTMISISNKERGGSQKTKTKTKQH